MISWSKSSISGNWLNDCMQQMLYHTDHVNVNVNSVEKGMMYTY